MTILHFPPRVLDASALVELLHGNPMLMRMLGDAHTGRLNVLLPATAVAEAQAAVSLPASMWNHVFGFRGVSTLNLHEHNAVEAGALAAPRLEHNPTQHVLTGALMVGHVLREAVATNGVIVTRLPELYGGHDVPVSAL